MFIHSVLTSHGVSVNFSDGKHRSANRISLLTGPNGSGKTDVLAAIAMSFYGGDNVEPPQALSEVVWHNGGGLRVVDGGPTHQYATKDRVRLIAQTFSPFSRFPPVPSPRSLDVGSIYGRGELSDEQYVCIGFHQNSQVDLKKLARSIIEEGLIRLSERRNSSRAIFDVLNELEFKDGVNLSYNGHPCLGPLMSMAESYERLEIILEKYRRTGNLVVDEEYFGKRPLRTLFNELQRRGAKEVAEYFRYALRLVRDFTQDRDWASEESEDSAAIARPVRIEFHALKDKHGMSSDFSSLQAISLLRRFQLLELVGCELSTFGGRNIDLTQTSSGQQQMLCSIFGLAAAIEDGAVIVIDEPELSLHPRWQMNFFKHLETALEDSGGCHVIMATHSPLITQAAVAHGVEVIQMGVRNGFENNPRERVSVEEVLVDVFDTPISNSLHLSKEIFGLITKAETGNYTDKAESLEKLEIYLRLYRRQGEGSGDMRRLLEKAIHLVSGATPKLG